MALIGISGKIGSGKDTVGKIIQELVLKHSKDEIIHSINNKFGTKEQLEDSGWQIKKNADGLKDMLCILIGCTREQLEDADFKNTPLGPEWDKYCITTIEGDWAVSTNGHAYYFTTEKEALVYLTDTSNFKVSRHSMTPRLMLQLLGTECIRNIIHPNAHVNMLFSKYKLSTYHPKVRLVSEKETIPDKPLLNQYPNWIITDVRFPNELEAVKSRGGITIRVERQVDSQNRPIIRQNEHESETLLDNAGFDYIIDNNCSMSTLIGLVKEILIEEKIIV